MLAANQASRRCALSRGQSPTGFAGDGMVTVD